MMLSATAPAPASETPMPPAAIASEAATDTAVMLASSVAATVMAPVRAVTSASAM